MIAIRRLCSALFGDAAARFGPFGGFAAVLGSAVVLAGQSALAGPAVNQFELKDLEAEPGAVEFQSQNAHSWGQPGRKAERDGGEIVYDDNSVIKQRHALEVEMSLTHFFRLRLGIEYEKERLEEPASFASANDFDSLKLDEVAIEGVAIFARVPEAGGVGVGMLAEFQHPLEAGELNSIVFGPILEAKYGSWGAVGNLTFINYFGGGDETPGGEPADKKWDLAYAGQVYYQASESWTFALEAYGTFDRLGNSGTPGDERAAFGDHDQHRIGPLIYYSFSTGARDELRGVSQVRGSAVDDDGKPDDDGMEVTIGTGLLFGLNENTPDTTLKWSVEVEF